MKDVMSQVQYSSMGKTVGIYVYIDGEKQLFTLESELREQIAQEIETEDWELDMLPHHDSALIIETYKHCANIARGLK